MATAASPTISGYCFEDYELDLMRGCLMHSGKELSLRYQSFQLLRYFVEHPGILITKDELTEAIWSDTSVTDNALVQCVTEIRRELNDDPHHPRFIKTFPKVGYRFIAAVEAVGNVPDAVDLRPHPIALTPAPQPINVASPTQSPYRSDSRATAPTFRLNRPWQVIPLGFLTLLVLMLQADRLSDMWLARASTPSGGPPILVVFSLKNNTGRQELDWMREGISDMIQTDLAHSGKWNVLSREEIPSFHDDAASERDPLEKELQAARSAHATAFIVGTILRSGLQNSIRVEVRDGKDGRLVTTDNAYLSDPREVVAEADLLSADIERHIGSSKSDGPPPEDGVTSNVEAYRYYSLGVEKAEQFQNTQAIEMFKKAIDFDPRFAMAYARIGYAYAVKDFQPAKARPYLERALRLSGPLPAVKRLYIEAWSAIAHSDYTAAIGILRQITNQYPDEIEAYCQLSRLLRGQESVQEAATLLQDAIQKNPDSRDLYNAFGLILISMGRPQDAIGAYKQYVALAPQNPNAHDSLGMSYQLAGQYEASLSEYNEALRLDPEFEPAIVHLGDVFYQEGRYRDALREYHRYIQVVTSNQAKAIGYGDLATVYRTMGDHTDAQIAASEEMRNNHNAVWDELVVSLDVNMRTRANAMQTALFDDPPNSERGSPRDLRMEFFYRGYIELKSGDPHGAINDFKLALQHLPPSSGIDLHDDCLANAYLDLNMIPEAVAEYQRILKLNPNYPLALYHLGVAYQRKHDRTNAVAAFQHFLQSSFSADQDSPAVLDAKRNLKDLSS